MYLLEIVYLTTGVCQLYVKESIGKLFVLQENKCDDHIIFILIICHVVIVYISGALIHKNGLCQVFRQLLFALWVYFREDHSGVL